MQPDAKLNFDRAAQALGLDPATRDLAWRRMTDIGLTPDDPTVVYLAVGGLLEKAAHTIPTALNAVPQRVEEAAERAVGPVASAAAERVAAAHAELVQRTGAAVAAEAAKHFGTMERSRARVAGVQIIVGVLIGTIACGITGYWLGRRDTAGIGAQWATLSQRADSQDWLKLIEANADLRDQMRKFCGIGPFAMRDRDGREYCNIPLWFDRVAAPQGGVIDAIYLSLRGWLSEWGPVWLMVMTGLGVLALRRVLRGFLTWRFVRWLLD